MLQYIIGEREKRVRHSQVCSIQIRDIHIYVTVPGKRVLVAQIMIFLYRRFSATTPKINSRDKSFVFVSDVSPTLCLHSR